MLIKVLGLIDLIVGGILIFGMEIIPNSILIIFGIILLAKSSLGLLKDFASWIDFLGGTILLLSTIISIPFIFSAIIGLLIIQKGMFSFL